MYSSIFVNFTTDDGTLIERIEIEGDDYNLNSGIHRDSLGDRLVEVIAAERRRQAEKFAAEKGLI